MNQGRLLILGLHRVGFPPIDAKIKGLFISPKLLEFHLTLIQKMGYEFTTLKQAMDKPFGKKAVITFDDGYKDNLTEAFPILQKFSAPATVFVVTDDVGKKNLVWEEAGEKLPSDLLTWSDLEFLQEKGWEIASHAHQHIHLARYNKKQQAKIIKKSIFEIEQNLGKKPVSFAYPYGSYNQNTKEILEELEIKYAVTINPCVSTNFSYNSKTYLELSRCSIGGRLWHHYVKSALKVKNAVGFVPLLTNLPRTLPKILTGLKQSYLGFRFFGANKNVVPGEQR